MADNALTPAEKRLKDKNKAQAERLEESKNRPEKNKQERELERRIDDLFHHLGGKLYNERELKLLKIQLKEKYGVELKFVDRDHSLNKKLIDWDKRGVVGSFTEAPPPSMFLRSDNASELTVFHEKVHLKVWFNKLDKMHIIDEEKLVWDAIWKTKDRWTNKELLDSCNYVNRMVQEYNEKGKNFPYLKNEDIENLKWTINL